MLRDGGDARAGETMSVVRHALRALSAIGLACALPLAASAQPSAIPPAVAQGLDSLIAGRNAAAVAVWGRAWTGSDTTQVATLLTSLEQIDELLGQATGYDLVKLFDIGPNLRQVYIVIRYDKQPLYARFLAYRPAREWKVNSVDWNTDATKVFPGSLLAPP